MHTRLFQSFNLAERKRLHEFIIIDEFVCSIRFLFIIVSRTQKTWIYPVPYLLLVEYEAVEERAPCLESRTSIHMAGQSTHLHERSRLFL